jgi:hypothetical protein
MLQKISIFVDCGSVYNYNESDLDELNISAIEGLSLSIYFFHDIGKKSPDFTIKGQ